MKGKRRNWIAKRVVPLLEPGETVRAAVGGATSPEWWTWLPVAGLSWLSSAEKVVILTDRNIYVFSGSELETIDQKHPVGMVEVRFDGRDLFVGTAKVRVYNGSHMDAAQLAEAAADDI